jgi:beta-glucosidase/6-phospho-beta-glucosidase/beta-galactosidase
MQVEGAWDKDGRTPSVWDVYAHIPGKIKNNDNGGCPPHAVGRVAAIHNSQHHGTSQGLKCMGSDCGCQPKGTGAAVL